MLDLFLRHGAFWEAIKGLRTKWDIEVSTEIPRREKLGDVPHPQNWAAESQSKEWTELSVRWGYDLDGLVFKFVSERFQNLDYYLLVWRSFFAACVLFDPPETTEDEACALLRFAEYGGPSSYHHDVTEEKVLGVPRAFFPAVKEMRDWAKTQAIEDYFWTKLLEKIDARLKPKGINLQNLIKEVLSDNPELRDFRREAEEKHNPFRFYIEADGYTTETELREALRILRKQQGTKLAPGRSARDRLTAVQAAILHDRHNDRDPQDGRRRLWTEVRLAKELGLPVTKKEIEKYPGKYEEIEISRAAEGHVALGRSILKEFGTR